MHLRSSLLAFSVGILTLSCTVNQTETSTRGEAGEAKSGDLVIEATSEAQAGDSIEIKWNAIADVSGYTLIVAKDEECKTVLFKFEERQGTSEKLQINVPGVYYFCVHATFADGGRIDATNTSKKITIASGESSSGSSSSADTGPSNAAPTISISQPDGVSDEIAESATTYTIEFSSADADSDALVTLYYNTTSPKCTDGDLTGWTEIANSIAESATSYVWNSGLPAAGATYYICAKIDDSVNDPVYALSPGVLSINEAPTISLTAPLGNDDASATSINLTWTDTDADNDATVKFYYDTSTVGPCTSGTQIGSDISEDDGTDSVSWDVSALASRIYYVCATIEDGVNAAVTSSYSDQVLVYDSGTCNWTGFVDSVFATVGNWVGCPGAGAPASSDDILVHAGSTNQPTVAASYTINKFASGIGGGTITVNSGVELILSTSTDTIASSITFEGATTTCTDCEVKRQGNITIINDATLTLGKGITLETGAYSSGYIYVGSSTESGHLVTTGGSTTAEKPVIEAYYDTQRGFIAVEGTSSAQSSVTIDGLVLNKVGNTQRMIDFVDYFTITQLDNLEMLREIAMNSAAASIDLSSCTNAVITDTTWDGINFRDAPARRFPTLAPNILADASCSTAISITNPSGFGWGADFEVDPNSAITWPTGTSYNCVWNASSAGTDFNDSAKWSGCGTPTGIPDQFSYIDIPAGANQPTLSDHVAVRGVNGTGGGTLTIPSGYSFNFVAYTDTVTSDITIQGSPTTSTDSRIYSSDDVVISSGATLTFGKGLNVSFGSGTAWSIAGNGTTAGHVVVSGGSNPSEWSHLGGSYQRAFEVIGVSGSNSSISIDGASFSYGAVLLNDYYEVVKLDNAILWGHSTQTNNSSYTSIEVNNSANATFTDTTWDGWSFYHNYNAGFYGVSATDLGTAITMTGQGDGFGTENDPNTNITWTANSCAGTSVEGFCWYLGADGASCDTTCASHGGVHIAGRAYAGYTYTYIDYARDNQCDAVLDALIGSVTTYNNSAVKSIGCAYDGATGRVYYGAKTLPSASEAGFQRACACQN